MGQPHPYADVIKAWADGAVVQFEDNGRWYDWRYEWSEYAPTFLVDFCWRVKPEPKRFRVALYEDNELVCVKNECEAMEKEQNTFFLRWLTDWIEYEVNEDE